MVIVAVIALASFLASFTDWLCFDVLIDRFYGVAPEVWRPRGGAGRIVVSQIIETMASAAVVVLCLWVPGRPLALAGLAIAALLAAWLLPR